MPMNIMQTHSLLNQVIMIRLLNFQTHLETSGLTGPGYRVN